jgi:catechol 2,3-dioxygenase-like lactoylglutathione lyase family enzyme
MSSGSRRNGVDPTTGHSLTVHASALAALYSIIQEGPMPDIVQNGSPSSARIGTFQELNTDLVVELPVLDLKRSLAFYEEAGFSVERATADFGALRWGGFYLFLAQREGVSPAPKPPNIRVLVDDLDHRFAEAWRLEWKIVHGPRDSGYGLRDFTVLDPDGYELRFATPAAVGRL